MFGGPKTYREFVKWRCSRPKPDTHDTKVALCDEIREAAGYYDRVMRPVDGTPRAIERELHQLRSINTRVHVAPCLRLLAEDAAEREAGSDPAETTRRTAAALNVLARWLTRVFYVGAPAGLNSQAADLAHRLRYDDAARKAREWESFVSGLRLTGVGVPSDRAVERATLDRRAYGGGATVVTKGVLYGIARGAGLPEPAPGLPAVEDMTVEHVMPRRLTDEWRADLGDSAVDVHDRWANKIANLTLLSPPENGFAGTAPFSEKRRVYAATTIPFSRELSEHDRWGEAEMEARSARIGRAVCDTWPWPAEGCRPDGSSVRNGRSAGGSSGSPRRLRYRIAGSAWREEPSAKAAYVAIVEHVLVRDGSRPVERALGSLGRRPEIGLDESRIRGAGTRTRMQRLRDGRWLFIDLPRAGFLDRLERLAREAGLAWGAADGLEIADS